MGIQKNTVKLVLILAIISIVPIQLAQSATHIATVIAAEITEPTLDGVFSTGEWDEDKIVQVRLDHMTNPGMYIMINMKATFDLAAESFSLGFSIPDPDADTDIILVIFQTNTNAELLDPTTMTFGADQDVKGFNCALQDTADGVTNDGLFSVTEDSTLGGTEEGAGFCTFSASQYKIEMTIPLDSGDTTGKDISLGLNDLIHFTVIYFENALDNIYAQVNTTSVDLGFNTLSIGNPLSGLFGFESLALYTALFTTLVIFVIIKRKRI